MKTLVPINSLLTDFSSNSKTKIKTVGLLGIVMFLLCLINPTFAQVSINESFDANIGSFTGSYDFTTTNACMVGNVRDNLWASSTTGDLTSANQVGASNATDMTIEFDYKILNYTGGTATGSGWGSATLEYSIDAGVTWVPVFTIDDSSHVTSTNCVTISQVVLAADLPMSSDVQVRINNVWLAGDYYFHVDNFAANQVVSSPPACSMNETATPDAACGNFDVPMTWDAVTGATGYKISIGTTSGGTDVENLTDLGATTSYNLTPVTGTSYFWTVTPYNGVGDAMGCTEFTFMTAAGGCLCTSVPTSVDGMGTGDIVVGTTTYASSGTVSYEDYTGGVVEPLSQGIQNNVMIEFLTGLTYDANIWIDFNDDFILDDATELVYSGTSVAANPTVLDASFVMPTTAPLGQHAMRIGTADLGQATPNACYNGTWGVTLDFTIEVIQASCLAAMGTATEASCDATAGFTIDVDVTGLGDGTVIITNDGGAAPVTVTALGITNIGPFPLGTPVVVTLEHPTDATCNIVLPAVNVGGCPPVNDDCSMPTPLTVNADLACGVTTPGTNAYATASPEDGSGLSGTPSQDVWFSFTATDVEHTVELQNVTAVVGTAIDMGMGLYDATGGCAALVLAGTSDPNTFNFTGLTVGTDYLLRVYGWSPFSLAQTTFDVCVGTTPPPPPNDECVNAIVLMESPDDTCVNSLSGDTAGATQSAEITLCSTTNNDDDVWYAFTPTTTADYTFATSNTASTTYVNIYSGTCAGGLTSVGASCFAASNTAMLTAATTYLVQVNTSSTTLFTTFDLCAYPTPPPPSNDDCVNALPLTESPDDTCANIVSGTTVSATQSTETSLCTTFSNDDDVWYTMTAAQSGSYTFETSSSDPGTTTYVHVYSGTCAGGLTSVGSCFSASNVAVLTAGTTYLVQVHTSSSTITTTFDLCAIAPPAPIMGTVGCGLTLPGSHCYEANDLTTWIYTASDGISPLQLAFTAGGLESCCDNITLYDGVDNTGAVLFTGNNGGSLAGVSVSSTGPNIFFEIDADGGVDCAAGSGCCTTAWDWTVECLSCTPGAGTADLGTCGNGFFIDVEVTNLGDGTIVIANDGGVAPVTVMALGVTSIGPFPIGTPVIVTLENPTNATCNVALAPVDVQGCPPANDDCSMAIPLTVNPDELCGTTTAGTNAYATASPEDPTGLSGTPSQDVWFSFTDNI